MTPSQAITTRAVMSPSGRSVRTPVTCPAGSRSRPTTVVDVSEVGAVVLGLAGEPVVEVGTVGGGPVVRRPAPRLGAEVDGQRLGLGEHHRRAAGDPTLDRRLLPPLRVQAVEDARVDDAAVHVLAAGERAPLEQEHRPPGAGEDGRRARTGRAGADDDGVVVRLSAPDAAPPSASSTALASATTARSAICIIGQCGSVLTLTMWSGAPSPAVCCTAPLMPKARYSDGSTTTPVVPIWRWCSTQPRSVITRVAPIAAPSGSRDASQLVEAVLAVQPGAAADDAVGLGEVHRRHVRRQHLDERRVGRRHRRRPLTSTRVAVGGSARVVVTPRTPGCSVTTTGPVDGHVDELAARRRGRGGRARGDQDGAGEQAPAERAGQARGEVAAVGRRREHDDVVVDERRQQLGPAAGREVAELDEADVGGDRRRARRRAAPTRRAGPARRTRRPPRRRPPAARRRGPGSRRASRQGRRAGTRGPGQPWAGSTLDRASSSSARPRLRTWRTTSMISVTDSAQPNARRNASGVVVLERCCRRCTRGRPRRSPRSRRRRRPSRRTSAHGWWVSPDVSVSAVRPPGMKRAVISSSPPRVRIWSVRPVEALRRLLRARRPAAGSTALKRRPMRYAVLSPRNAPRAPAAITSDEVLIAGAGGDAAEDDGRLARHDRDHRVEEGDGEDDEQEPRLGGDVLQPVGEVGEDVGETCWRRG